MLLPTLSVTVIGLIAGFIAASTGARQFLFSLAVGIVGAWVGFIVGALLGVTIDVILGSGIFVVIIGHTAAAGGALLALRRFRTGWPSAR